MRADWEVYLERWSKAGLLDASMAGRIREWETSQAGSRGLRWPVMVALAFGVLLLGAGVLLFVSAHWDFLAASQRMGLVLLLTSCFHIGGAAVAGRFEGLSVALHATGTICLGAGIALAGQIFHLSEHWPGAIMLWTLGAALGWALLRQWPQAALVAALLPSWLCSEWEYFSERTQTSFLYPMAVFACALSFAYLGGRRSVDDSALRKALGWIGGFTVLPGAIALAAQNSSTAPDWRPQGLAWTVAIVGPLLVSYALRGPDLLWNAGALLWCLALAWINSVARDSFAVYLWCALGAAGLAAWGIRESRAERINLGIAGFAIDVMIFYFSNVMDKLGRSASLMLLGVLFLGGGWLLERTRRRLVASIQPEDS